MEIEYEILEKKNTNDKIEEIEELFKELTEISTNIVDMDELDVCIFTKEQKEKCKVYFYYWIRTNLNINVLNLLINGNTKVKMEKISKYCHQFKSTDKIVNIKSKNNNVNIELTKGISCFV